MENKEMKKLKREKFLNEKKNRKKLRKEKMSLKPIPCESEERK